STPGSLPSGLTRAFRARNPLNSSLRSRRLRAVCCSSMPQKHSCKSPSAQGFRLAIWQLGPPQATDVGFFGHLAVMATRKGEVVGVIAETKSRVRISASGAGFVQVCLNRCLVLIPSSGAGLEPVHTIPALGISTDQ